MRYLILKDFKVVGKIYLFLISISIVFSTVSMISDSGIESKMIYIAAIIISVIFPHMFIIGKDIQYNSDKLFNSLPITRRVIVKSKYLFIFISLLFSTFAIFLYSNGLSIFFPSTFNGSPMSLLDMISVISMLLSFFSVNLFITYLNIKKAQYFNQLIYILTILVPVIISKLLQRTNLGKSLSFLYTLNSNLIFTFFLLIGVFFYIISMQLSKVIYENKDF